MPGYIDYVNSSLSDIEDSKSLQLFKQRIIAEMTKRSADLIEKGVKDEQVVTNIIIGEYPDLKARYLQEIATKENNRKKKVKNTKVGFLSVAGYVLALVFVYLSVSFLTTAWHETWLILVGGLLAPMGLLMISSAFKSRKGGIVQRAGIFFGVMLIVTVLFLFMIIVLGISKSWILFLLGIVAAMVVDAGYATACKEKVSYGTYILYLPAVATLVYVIGGIAKFIPWHPGWMLILAAVIADIFILIYKVITSKN